MADDHAPLRPTEAELLARITMPADATAYRAEIQRGLDDLAARRTISGEAMHRWVRSWFTDNESPPPECGD